MSNKQKTAVEWLYFELFYFLNAKSKFGNADEILERAKEMEKEQMIDFGAKCLQSQNEKQGGNK